MSILKIKSKGGHHQVFLNGEELKEAVMVEIKPITAGQPVMAVVYLDCTEAELDIESDTVEAKPYE